MEKIDRMTKMMRRIQERQANELVALRTDRAIMTDATAPITVRSIEERIAKLEKTIKNSRVY